MNRHKFGYLLAAIPVAGVVVLAGCSGGGSGQTGGDSQEFSLTFATSDVVESPWERLAEAYEADNPDVTITLNPLPNDQYDQTLRTQLQAGNASDVMATSPGSGQGRSIIPLAEAGFLEPLGEEAENVIPAGSESLFELDGKVYGQALSITFAGMIQNATTSEAAGVEFPTDWDSLLTACDTAGGVADSLIAVAGAQPPNTGLMAMVIAATRVYAEDPDWNQQRIDGDVTFADSEGWQEALQTIVDLNAAGCFQPGVEGAGFEVGSGNVAGGKSFAGFFPSGIIKDLQAASPDAEYIIRAFPPVSDDDTPFGYASANYSVSLNAEAENKEAAAAFLDWIAEPENSGLYAEVDGSLPIDILNGEADLADTPYAEVADIINEGNYAPLPNTGWSNPAVYEALGSGVQGLLTGQKTVEQVLEDMDAAW
ncbi:MAG TPA: extracellular solute-binding protein [Microbacterium sp.]|uniref:ABC transporter substrate-binding protein n=1 Tax=Microbacterium sp. TaxID=51671 RepID=UPI002C538479|nr:extracellular solute-binding protein [Microbacterium sp.]HWI30747.1 extracellular solute-binding protein [Microbacterium sp.]